MPRQARIDAPGALGESIYQGTLYIKKQFVFKYFPYVLRKK